jgi:hypothetical protein
MWVFLLLLSPFFIGFLFCSFMEHREKDKEESNSILAIILFFAILILLGQIFN